MKPVILVTSCRKDAASGLNDAIRETWGKNPAMPVFFLLGRENGPAKSKGTSVLPMADEVILAVNDDYLSLPCKTQQGHRWARERGYDYIFQCFTDTYVDTGRLIQSGYERGHYVGNQCLKGSRGHDFCHGGPGYWLSPKATDLMLAASIGTETLEDQWIGSVMEAAGIPIMPDFRYSMGTTYCYREAKPMPGNQQISCHLSDSGHRYEAAMMFAAQRLRMTGT